MQPELRQFLFFLSLCLHQNCLFNAPSFFFINDNLSYLFGPVRLWWGLFNHHVSVKDGLDSLQFVPSRPHHSLLQLDGASMWAENYDVFYWNLIYPVAKGNKHVFIEQLLYARVGHTIGTRCSNFACTVVLVITT